MNRYAEAGFLAAIRAGAHGEVVDFTPVSEVVGFGGFEQGQETIASDDGKVNLVELVLDVK